MTYDLTLANTVVVKQYITIQYTQNNTLITDHRTIQTSIQAISQTFMITKTKSFMWNFKSSKGIIGCIKLQELVPNETRRICNYKR